MKKERIVAEKILEEFQKPKIIDGIKNDITMRIVIDFDIILLIKILIGMIIIIGTEVGL